MHFWASDLLCFLIAFCLYALFLIPPGAVLAYYFRVRLAAGSPRDNIAAALVLSASCLPALMFLAGHFFSNAGVWMLMGTFWLAFAATFSRLKLAVSPKVIAGAIVVALLCYFSLADLPAKHRLFGSDTNLDYVKHVAVTSAVARTGVEPFSPFLRPGYDLGLFYYFYWYLVSGWVLKCAAPFLNALPVSLAGTAWVVLAFLSVLWLYLRHLSGDDEKQLRLRWRRACVLLLVTGLDLIGASLVMMQQRALGRPIFFTHLEHWNSPQVTSWVATFVWVPQHVIALVSGVAALLLARQGAESRRLDGGSIGHSVLAGLCLATTIGASVFVAMGICAGIALWAAWCLIRREWSELRAFVLAGALSVVFIVPYLQYLRRLDYAHAPPVHLTVRDFSLVDPYTQGLSRLSLAAVRLAALPVNYGFEFGFYAVVAGIYLFEAWRRKRTLLPIERAGLAVGAACLLIATFFESQIVNLGMRVCLPPQFFMLLMGILVLERQPPLRTAFRQRSLLPKVLAVCAVVGIAGTTYDWFGTRFADVFRSRNGTLAGDHNPNLRYEIRQAYDFVHAHTSRNSVVQQNPGQRWAVLFGLYGDRPVAVSDPFHGPMFSVPPREYQETMSDIGRIFQRGASIDELYTAVRRYSLAAILVRRTDPLWGDRTAWTQTRKPDFETALARVYLFHETAGSTQAVGKDTGALGRALALSPLPALPKL